MQPYPTYFNQPGPQATYPPPLEPRGRGARPYTGAKRGRKPRGGGPNTAAPSTRPEAQPQPGAHAYPIQTVSQPPQQSHPPSMPQYYAQQQHNTMMPPPQYTPINHSLAQKAKGKEEDNQSVPRVNLPTVHTTPSTFAMRYPSHHPQSHPVLSLPPLSSPAQTNPSQIKQPSQVVSGADDEDDAEDLPVMSDDVYGQGLLWQSQSKDNLKCVPLWLPSSNSNSSNPES